MKPGTVLALLLAAAALAGCAQPTNPPPPGQPGSPAGGSPSPQANLALNGAGSTFVNPLMSKWASVYNQQTGVQVNYQSIGSGGGIKALTDKTVDFAGSDAPLSASQAGAAPGTVHIPESLGAVAVIFNVPGVRALNLTGPVLADIYLGNVKTWNDPAIARLNPGAALPGSAITTVHRSDGSGTTYAFTDYLSKVSGAWRTGPGKGTSVAWPAAAQPVGGKGSEGVSALVQGNPSTIGYVELTYANLNGLTGARLQNKAGSWVSPTLQGASAAAAQFAGSLPAGNASWSDVSIVDAGGADAYPISTFTYVIAYQDPGRAYAGRMDLAHAQALARFLWWAVHDGQQYSEGLQYSRLPAAVVQLDEATLRGLTFDGQSLVG